MEVQKRMKTGTENACLICGKPLQYFNSDKEVECMICHGKFKSKAQCVDGHYICDNCHAKQGITEIEKACLGCSSKNPEEILINLMKNDNIHMHGPEHHILVGAALLTAYRNTGGSIELKKALEEMTSRGQKVPGGACGFWGSCGAGISSGMFASIITETTPLSGDSWGMANSMTSRALHDIGKVGGPRCCKRNSFLTIRAAVQFVKERMGIEMELKENIVCEFSERNAQCIGDKCPFNKTHYE